MCRATTWCRVTTWGRPYSYALCSTLMCAGGFPSQRFRDIVYDVSWRADAIRRYNGFVHGDHVGSPLRYHGFDNDVLLRATIPVAPTDVHIAVMHKPPAHPCYVIFPRGWSGPIKMDTLG